MFFMCPKENLFAKNHSCKFLSEIGDQPDKKIDKLLPKPEPETHNEDRSFAFFTIVLLTF